MASKNIQLHVVPTLPARRHTFSPTSSSLSSPFTMTDLRVHDDRSSRSRWSDLPVHDGRSSRSRWSNLRVHDGPKFATFGCILVSGHARQPAQGNQLRGRDLPVPRWARVATAATAVAIASSALQFIVWPPQQTLRPGDGFPVRNSSQGSATAARASRAGLSPSMLVRFHDDLAAYPALFIPFAIFTAATTPFSLATAWTFALSAADSARSAPRYCP